MSLTRVSSVFFLMLLAACGQEEPQHSQTTAPVYSPEAMSHDLGPFFQSEAAMFDNMRSAIGMSSSDNWVRMMIAHHEGGAAISRVVLEEYPPPQIATLARSVIHSQNEAVRELQTLARAGPSDVETAFIFVGPIQAMYDATMAVEGPDASEVWLRKIIEHHRGAIEMSDVLLRQPGTPKDITSAVRKLQREQSQQLMVLEPALADLYPQLDLHS